MSTPDHTDADDPQKNASPAQTDENAEPTPEESAQAQPMYPT